MTSSFRLSFVARPLVWMGMLCAGGLAPDVAWALTHPAPAAQAPASGPLADNGANPSTASLFAFGGPAYMSLVKNYSQVRARMMDDIAAGRGEVWSSWMQPGVDLHQSLPTWLRAQWFWSNHHPDQAYQSMVTAVVLTRLEMAGCDNKRQSSQMALDALLQEHHDMTAYRPSQPVVRQAVLQALGIAQQMLDDHHVAGAMACHQYMLAAFQARQGSGTLQLITKKPELVEAAQWRELDRIKKDFSYQKLWQNIGIGDAWDNPQLKSH